jgi:2,4-dienoyl-CoA reductase-like NADH-dependent reductase (Old Yellow Enzyme family)
VSSTVALFDPFRIGPLELSNRIVMAPMTRALSPGGVPGSDVAAYYQRRAAQGVGLIITEGTVVDHPASSTSTDVPRFYGTDALTGWAEAVRRVHIAGGRIVPQLWHVGLDPLLWGQPDGEAQRMFLPGIEAISPSGIDPCSPGVSTGRAMTSGDIDDVIGAFARAAAEAHRLGFDGIELHAAHGYLIDQFLWDVTNQRTDHYGGHLSSRARFAADIVRACRAATAPDFPILLRFSQWKVGFYNARLAHTPQDLEALLEPLVDAGVDAFHCSTRRFWRPEFDGSPLNLAGWTKQLSGKPSITVGSVGLQDSDFLDYLSGIGAATGDVTAVAQRLATGEFDLVAVGRALIADPAWPAKIRDGRTAELVAFDVSMLETLD